MVAGDALGAFEGADDEFVGVDFLAWGGGVGALGVGAGRIRVGAVVALTHGRVRR